MIDLITDRASSDVTLAAALLAKWPDLTDSEQALWDAGLKGSYNASDLNRVTAALVYLDSTLKTYGYTSGYTPVIPREWVKEDEPTEDQLAAYLANVRAVRDTLLVTSPIPDSMLSLTAEGANEIERALVAVEETIRRVVAGQARSDSFMFISDNRPIPTARSDLGRTVADLDAEGVRVADLDAHGTSFYILSYGVLT